MSDRFPAEIRIGGSVQRSKVEGLCKAIAARRLALTWDGPTFEPKTVADLLKGAKDSMSIGVLVLRNSEACYGSFPELEEFLEENGIAFERHSDAYAEYGGVRVMFRPGLPAKAFPATQSDELLVSAEQVAELSKDIIAGTTDPQKAADELLKLAAGDYKPLEAVTIAEG